MAEFPKDFLWGAATSAHQVEGNNINSDWWHWEKKSGLKETSGLACRHYEFYKGDFDLAHALSHNAHRLSIEWSRIEPKEGEFSDKEINHYVDVILSLKERNIEPIVTLHHFTNPYWFAELGGWQNKKAVSYFLRYVDKIVGILSDKVRFWVTINEPMVYVYFSYIVGQWPPEVKSFSKAKIVKNNLAIAHIRAYRLIHKVFKLRNLPTPSVSIAHNMQAFTPYSPTLKNRLAGYLRDKLFNFSFIERLIRARSLDFIGLNYYNRSLVDVRKWCWNNLLLDTSPPSRSELPKNSLGWDIYPQGLHSLLAKLKNYKLPVFILENGICTEDDNLRWDFIEGHLKSMHQAMQEGTKVLGYIYWSLLDNFEWDKGFAPRFGLIGIDYNTQDRLARESAKKFAQVCKTNKL